MIAGVIIYYALLLISILLYYKIRKIRQPFTKLGSYKDDVSLGEKICISLLVTIPMIIVFFVL